MPLLVWGVQMMTRRMPKVISPKTHAILDLALAGSFLVAGIMAWRRRQHKSAISSWIVAGSQLGLAMITDYPAGVTRLISFPLRGKINAGLCGMIASMPNLMGFEDGEPAGLFRVQAMLMAALNGMTDFEGTGRTSRERYRAA